MMSTSDHRCGVMLLGLYIAVAAATTLLASSGPAAGASKVTLIGQQVAPGKYTLALDPQLAEPDSWDGVLIFAEPSHTLLLVLNNEPNGGVRLAKDEHPLAFASGRLGRSAPKITVRYEAGGDTRIVVQLAAGAERLTVSDAQINVAAFHFSTTFHADGTK